METSIFLAQLFGLTMIVAGLALLVRGKSLMKEMPSLVKDNVFMFYSGVLSFVIGLTIVLKHNIWDGTAWQIIITVFGWYALLKALALLFIPGKMFKKFIKTYMKHPSWLIIDGLIVIVIGVYLAAYGFGWF